MRVVMKNPVGIRIVEPSVEMITPKYFPNWKEGWTGLIEECGRVSHKSEGRIGPGTAGPFIDKIANRFGHESIVEHGVFTVCFTMSRAASHQLVRHRISAFTQESQRYCDYSSAGQVFVRADEGDGKFLNVICPPSIISIIGRLSWVPTTWAAGDFFEHDGAVLCWDVDEGWCEPVDWFMEKRPDVHGVPQDLLLRWVRGKISAYRDYLYFREQHIPAEDARYDLPNAAKTEVYTTFNFRTWRHALRQRGLNTHAQWEIRQLIKEAYNWFMAECPLLFNPHTIGHVEQSLMGLPVLLVGDDHNYYETNLTVMDDVYVNFLNEDLPHALLVSKKGRKEVPNV